MSSSASLLSGSPAVVSTPLVNSVGATPATPISFYGKSPAVAQATNAIPAAAYAPVGGGNVQQNDTFGGYTIGQVVAALQRAGLLA